ncbi:MAG: hypothetical protein ACTSRU_04855 [Candidatus Hodarchaeales archaeon]
MISDEILYKFDTSRPGSRSLAFLSLDKLEELQGFVSHCFQVLLIIFSLFVEIFHVVECGGSKNLSLSDITGVLTRLIYSSRVFDLLTRFCE